jgi:hypothetical protein
MVIREVHMNLSSMNTHVVTDRIPVYTSAAHVTISGYVPEDENKLLQLGL